MKRELTKVDVEQLYAFTRKHAVDTYDVQSELVDHLASDIEQQWEQNPNLTLEEALQHVFSKFGNSGFTVIFKQRIAAIKREHRMLWFRTFLTFFKLPYLVFSLLLFVIFLVALTEFNPDLVTLVALFLHLVVGLYFKQKDYAFKTGRLRKKLSILQDYDGLATLSFFPMYLNYLLLDKILPELTWPFALNFTISYILTITYIRTVIAIRQRAQVLYPAAFA